MLRLHSLKTADAVRESSAPHMDGSIPYIYIYHIYTVSPKYVYIYIYYTPPLCNLCIYIYIYIHTYLHIHVSSYVQYIPDPHHAEPLKFHFHLEDGGRWLPATCHRWRIAWWPCLRRWRSHGKGCSSGGFGTWTFDEPAEWTWLMKFWMDMVKVLFELFNIFELWLWNYDSM